MDPRWKELLRHADHERVIRSVSIIIRDGVFTPDPDISLSTTALLDTLPNLQGKSVLDLGCGTGIVGIWCAQHGARHVLCTDIDEQAVQNTQENILAHRLERVITTRRTNLFEGVTEKFDVIAANLPINEEVWDAKRSPRAIMEQFFSGLAEHLTPKGVALVTWASFGEVEVVEAAAIRQGFTFTRTNTVTDDIIWYVYTITP